MARWLVVVWSWLGAWGCVDDFPAFTVSAMDRGEVDAGADARSDGGRDAARDMRMADMATPDACRPMIELCNGIDDNCNGQIDENQPRRQCERTMGVCAGTTVACVDGRYGECNYALVNPAYEDDETRCDMLDNDCDGRTDEGCGCTPGETRPCGTDEGTCEMGVLRCVDGIFGQCEDAVGPQPETCNGLDDDCNGTVDDLEAACETELQGRCTAGTLRCDPEEGQICVSDVMPMDESCNGVDDDCDGLVDDGLDDQACNTGEPGICRAGLTRCDGERIQCDLVVRPNTVDEQCNGADDDCDGEVDNLPFAVCVSGELGECSRGRRACNNRNETYCAPIQAPVPEVCDRLDNDCDGVFDESVPSQMCDLGDAGGVCGEGRTVCENGEIRCVAVELQADDASCDGVDDDCDGRLDEDYRFEDCETGNNRCPRGDLICTDGRAVCQPRPTGRDDDGLDGVDDDCDGVVDEDEITLFFEDLMLGGTGARPGLPGGPVPGYDNATVRGVNAFPPDLSPVPIVDWVFKPAANGQTIVSSTGLMVDLSDDVGNAESWSPPAKGPWEYVERGIPPLMAPYMIELHSNMGITFDLDALDVMYPNHELHQMRSRAGASSGGRVKIMLLVDGRVHDQGVCINYDRPGSPDLESLNNLDGGSLRAARFITFVAVDCGQDNIGAQHGLVHDARLVMRPR